MIVQCFENDCIYNKECKCDLSIITIGENKYCSDFCYYRDALGYGDPYFKACLTKVIVGRKRKDKNDIVVRRRAKGKKIVVNGREFFTDSDIRLSDSEIYVTDGKTGYYCGCLSDIKKNWKNVLIGLEKLPDVMTYPDNTPLQAR